MQPTDPDPRRQLGLPTAVGLVAASMIGAGVFTTSGFALADLGRRGWVLAAWLAGGLLALCGALCYGALGRRMPGSGGEYFFLGRILHPRLGFLAGWISLLAGFTAPIAVSGLVFGTYLAPGDAARQRWLGSGVILAAVLMHGVRLRPGAWIQNGVVAVQLALLIGLIGFGAWRADAGGAAELAAGAPELGAFCVSLVWISFSYSGWNAAVYVGGEIRDPERNLPRALLSATLLVTAVYVAINAVFLYSAEPAELAGRPDVAAVAARALGGEALERGVAALIALALFTSVCAMVMAGPRVYARMADDGLFPRIFSSGDAVPTAAVAFQGLAALAVLWTQGLAELLGYVGFTLGLSAAATVVSLIVLRAREGPARVPVPGYPLVPLVYVAGVVGASSFMALREPRQALLGLLTALTGLPLYEIVARRRRRGVAGPSSRA